MENIYYIKVYNFYFHQNCKGEDINKIKMDM